MQFQNCRPHHPQLGSSGTAAVLGPPSNPNLAECSSIEFDPIPSRMWQASAIGIDEYNQFAESIKEELLNSNLSALQLFVCFMAGTGPEDMLLKAKIFIKDIVIAWLGLLECNEPLILVPFIATGECKSADQFWDSFDEFYEDLVDVIKPFTRIWSQINEYLDNLLCARPLIRWELNKFDILLGWRLSQLVCLYSGTFVEYIGEIGKIVRSA